MGELLKPEDTPEEFYPNDGLEAEITAILLEYSKRTGAKIIDLDLAEEYAEEIMGVFFE